MLMIGISTAALADEPAAAVGAQPLGAAQQGDVRVARLTPELGSEDPDRTVLPRPLSESDAELYRRLFALEAEGRRQDVDRLAVHVENRLLLGHLLASRYLERRDYKPSFGELAEWLILYGDHPQAEKVYALARKRRPAGASIPRPLSLAATHEPSAKVVEDGQSYTSSIKRPKAIARKVTAWRRQIPQLIRQGKLDEAQAALSRPEILPLLDMAELDIARWQVGQALLAAGENKRAYELTSVAAYRSAAVLPAMAWTAGLAAWRIQYYADAQRFFTDFTNRRTAVPAEAAMGAFWAARASLAANRPQFVPRFMRLAAATGDSFYGRLAQAVLGDPLPSMAEEPGLDSGSVLALLKYAAGRRALALGQIDRPDLAEIEIASLARRHDDPNLTDALWKLAELLELPPEAVATISVAAVDLPDKRYPVPKLQKRHFELDRALVLAVIRAESGFDELATSSAGARGLMQIMPETAAAIAKRDGTAFSAEDLHDPLINLKMGQAYLKQLMKQKEIGSNLIFLAAAYNAGPGRVIQWRERNDGNDDPLYFVESIPLTETRTYVKRVLAAYWAYQERFEQAATSLDELRLGSWPTYKGTSRKVQTAEKS
ncbi:MAG TPA: lytic transglycosylase domain-containing protein [Geminicoccus sp.]|jgi:soluble lytic murein transglycosylase-like protein|uniref:lytic transglycosylase domain-containing protein n=1 Tax=Geminicoccus sp. TaxID=2024832 RepID=UPI002E31B39D|nr:lytic transglycosylase domain-containing protein [Geminicoccus sp.]HEX2526509.1 lytic transglycosylase domain-containing protein [Geminicoccus sp.]